MVADCQPYNKGILHCIVLYWSKVDYLFKAVCRGALFHFRFFCKQTNVVGHVFSVSVWLKWAGMRERSSTKATNQWKRSIAWNGERKISMKSTTTCGRSSRQNYFIRQSITMFPVLLSITAYTARKLWLCCMCHQKWWWQSSL